MSSITIPQKKEILDRINQIVDDAEQSFEEKLQAICEFLEEEVDIFDWVGFYLVDPQADRELVLGPYVGEPTDHSRIPFGKGICGQAAETNDTFVVQDVNEAENYLSCSIHVKAEIVVPIKKEGEFVAELDIDSHTRASITGEHRNMLEGACKKIADLF